LLAGFISLVLPAINKSLRSLPARFTRGSRAPDQSRTKNLFFIELQKQEKALNLARAAGYDKLVQDFGKSLKAYKGLSNSPE
jgi:hypothetical protein